MADFTTQQEPDESTWPSVSLAYEFVRPSYEFMAHRLDAVEGRIRALLTLAASATFAAPVFVTSIVGKPDFRSPWLIASLVLFGLTVLLGIAAHMAGSVRVASPRLLYENWLHYSEWEFKKNMVYWAGVDFEANSARVNTKGWIATVIGGILLAEGVCLIVWAVQSTA